jgi:hypothetical protein
MAQSLTQKIEKLAAQFNIDAIIKTAQQVKVDAEDTRAWDAMSTDEKTAWFMAQCSSYGLTTRQRANQIIIEELREVGDHMGTKAYFTVFLPRNESIGRPEQLSDWKLEIGGSYIRSENGGIWSTHPGLKGKEKQIAEVIRLNKLGQ